MLLNGIERRPLAPEEEKDSLNLALGGRDREAFSEFYAGYDKRATETVHLAPPIRRMSFEKTCNPREEALIREERFDAQISDA